MRTLAFQSLTADVGEVSNLGRVRRCKPHIGGYRKGYSVPAGKILQPSKSTKRWYPTVHLSNGDRSATRRIPVLVCEAFHGPRPSPDHVVAHWDGDKDNNTESNLRWATLRENYSDSIRQGVTNRGERSPMAKLTEHDVIEIRALLASGFLHREIAANFGVHRKTIGHIANKETWGWLMG